MATSSGVQKPAHIVIPQGATFRMATVVSAGPDPAVLTAGWKARMMLRQDDYDGAVLIYLRTDASSEFGYMTFDGNILRTVLYDNFTAALDRERGGVLDVEVVIPGARGETRPTVLRALSATFEVSPEVTRDSITLPPVAATQAGALA